ncbi:hypothetical protein COU56_00215 [Candidatus Pacearchaeota archaeon CG10_big_fil_rev_8_21_14_0_10_31_9]|nr:MAG: hypothetical protein AUJ62_00640 [Candidatus Pacearchaeota archaeon CG1_02_32_21]PIN96474.1 MAG: hypothetical protein COU56_00215 [Candidatus Pacearchaeota archaeon CG10_big_fil_rev_8_21_14_0_10_31_9]PIZ82577.1 MAG: hypothetical protein COX97_04080 [Candidatus Pacearchaeota archaeon CG_4_10_14_0_2_um_filter_05_32_18]
MKDSSKEVKELINHYKEKGIVFGKEINFIIKRIELSKENIEKEIFTCKNLYFTDKQAKDNEVRYVLYFIYTHKRGRQYVLTFRDNNIRIITAFPLGRRTIKKYKKKGLNI